MPCLQGKVGRALEYSRNTLNATADLLMTNALRRAESRGEKVTVSRSDWQWWGREFVDKNPYKVRVALVGDSRQHGQVAVRC